MRALVAVALLATSVALAQDSFLKGDELKAEIAKSCSDGCVTFNREEAAQLQEYIKGLIAQAQAQAFEEGKQSQKAACRSLI